MSSTKDIFGNVIPGTNLTEVMENCTDFINEMTQLQEVMGRLGISVHRSPKCHAELAGKGIKYSWGFFKILGPIIRYGVKPKNRTMHMITHDHC